jgi:hypothetical protein
MAKLDRHRLSQYLYVMASLPVLAIPVIIVGLAWNRNRLALGGIFYAAFILGFAAAGGFISVVARHFRRKRRSRK